MPSLEERIEVLERDLATRPPRIAAHHDLPFAIFRYDPTDEFACRQRVRLLAISLEANHGRRAIVVSLGEILWRAIEKTEGIAAIAAEERQLGFDRAQRTVATLISDPSFAPLSREVVRRAEGLDPERDVLFLVRAAALAPALYHMSKLLDELHGKTLVPVVLFYPGSLEGNTGLRFMAMEDREAIGNYRVKIY